MNKFFYKYLIALLIIIVGSWTIVIIEDLIGKNDLILLVRALLLFAFGISLQTKRRYKTWIKKLIIAFIFSYLVFYQLGYFQFTFVNKVFSLLAFDRVAFILLYIYLGWLFFDWSISSLNSNEPILNILLPHARAIW